MSDERVTQGLGEASGTGSHASHEAPTGLRPSGFDPSRDRSKPYIVGALDERKAVSRYLTVRAARALNNAAAIPWWNLKARLQARFTAVAYAMAAVEIEGGDHVEETALWLIRIDGHGTITARECIRRDSDGSGEAGETQSGSTEGDSAGREASPVTPCKETNNGK